MKKTLFISLMLLIAILALPSVVKAETSEVVLESIQVSSPASGTYTTGQVITIDAIFSGNVVAEEEVDIPTLRLKFGNSEEGEVSTTTGTVKGNVIEYKYTITNEDSGELSLVDYLYGLLKDEEGSRIEITVPEALTGNKISANPMEWTDTSNLKIWIDNGYWLYVEGLTELFAHSYYVFVTNTAEEPELVLDNSGCVTNHTEYFSNEYLFNKYLEKSGDIYYWICEEQRNYATGKMEQKFIVSAKKIERPAQKSLGSRIECFFFSDLTSTYLNEPYEYEEARKMQLKIGKVTDKSILLSIKNEEEGALAKLLTYAKSAEALYTTTVPLGDSSTITDKFELINDEYYYVYAEMDDGKGVYYPVEDVSLYQGCVGERVGKNLFNYLDGDFTWNIEEQDYFSNFNNAKVLIESLELSEEKLETSIAINDVISNLDKKHQFYYYISNSAQDVPSYDSNLWTKVDKFTINELDGKCYISTGNIMDLSYADKLNVSEEIYISIYEVVADEEITAETISGEYKLGLNAKKVVLELGEDGNTDEDGEKKDEDTTTAPDTELPQTGVNVITMISLIMIIMVIAMVTFEKYRNMKDIK